MTRFEKENKDTFYIKLHYLYWKRDRSILTSIHWVLCFLQSYTNNGCSVKCRNRMVKLNLFLVLFFQWSALPFFVAWAHLTPPAIILYKFREDNLLKGMTLILRWLTANLPSSISPLAGSITLLPTNMSSRCAWVLQGSSARHASSPPGQSDFHIDSVFKVRQ